MLEIWQEFQTNVDLNIVTMTENAMITMHAYSGPQNTYFKIDINEFKKKIGPRSFFFFLFVSVVVSSQRQNPWLRANTLVVFKAIDLYAFKNKNTYVTS